MSKLKPCPFCGSADVDRHGWYDGEGHRGPECMGCGATGASEEVWNRRAVPPIGDCHRIEKYASELERLRATFRLTERFVNAKGRYHSQLAMCDLMEHFGKSCVRPDPE